MHLSRADEQRLRRVDLVERLMLTPSGVTRLLEGLQEAGLVENVHCESDARVTWAQLTQEGSETLDCVGASHTERLRALFRGTLSEDEVEQLSELAREAPRRRRRVLQPARPRTRRRSRARRRGSQAPRRAPRA